MGQVGPTLGLGRSFEWNVRSRETYPDSVHVLHAHIAKVEHVGRRPRGRLRGPLRHRGLVVYLQQELGTDDWCSFRVYTIRVSGDVGRTCMKHVIWHISSFLDRALLSVGLQHLRMMMPLCLSSSWSPVGRGGPAGGRRGAANSPRWVGRAALRER